VQYPEDVYRVVLDQKEYLIAPGADDAGIYWWWSKDAPAVSPSTYNRLVKQEGHWEKLGKFNPSWAAFIESSGFASLPHHERLYQLSVGYLQSAKSLCSELLNNTELLDWPRASVVCYCVTHAIELFLKAGISAKSAGDQQAHHRIRKLFTRYTELYPNPDFHFPHPWPIDEEDLEIFVGAKIFDGLDKKKDQVYRYTAAKDGQPPKGMYYFGPFTWLEEIKGLEANWQRIWPKIMAKIDA
jgi:hypothetical protein